MKYILEVYYQGDCIEQRERDQPWYEPQVGEQIYLEPENTNISEEHGFWWVVLKRRHLLFGPDQNLNTLMLHCEPDPDKGDPQV